MLKLEDGTVKTRVRYKCYQYTLPGVSKVESAFSSILVDVDDFMACIADELRARGYRVFYDSMCTVTSVTVEVGSSDARWDRFHRDWDRVVEKMAAKWRNLVWNARRAVSDRFPDRATVEDASGDEWCLLATVTLPRGDALELYTLEVRITEDEVDDAFLCEAPFWVFAVTVYRAPGLSDDDLERVARMYTHYFNDEEETVEVLFTSDGKIIPLSEPNEW